MSRESRVSAPNGALSFRRDGSERKTIRLKVFLMSWSLGSGVRRIVKLRSLVYCTLCTPWLWNAWWQVCGSDRRLILMLLMLTQITLRLTLLGHVGWRWNRLVDAVVCTLWTWLNPSVVLFALGPGRFRTPRRGLQLWTWRRGNTSTGSSSDTVFLAVVLVDVSSSTIVKFTCNRPKRRSASYLNNNKNDIKRSTVIWL